LVFRLRATSLIFLPKVNLPTDSPAVFGDKSGHVLGIPVRMIMDEHPHHILRTKLVLSGKLPIMSSRVDEQHLILALDKAVLA